MLSHRDGRNSEIQHQTNEVIFRNVRSRYKFENKISVLYVLSPKTKTSTHDYVGIYPRGWNHLREFVAFEHPIRAPSENPSLDRCIQFICVPPHIKATLYQDYQFVYVNQYHEVLGKSDFFQFVKDDEDISSDCAAGYQETNLCDENDSEWQKGSAFENVQQYVSDAEYDYNTCYFGQKYENTNQEAILQSNVTFGGLDEASNACYTPSIENQLAVSKSHFSSEESCYQNSDQESYYKPKRGRPLVKTRDQYSEYQSVSPEPPSSMQRKYSTYMNNRGIDATQEVPYSRKWLPSKTWHYQPNNVTQIAPYSGRSDVNRGAIPKQCPKCKVSSDYIYKQQLMRHDLDQAHEQIRDLNTRVDQLQQELQLSYAAQAKLKVVAEIAKAESKNAVSFLNSLMLSLVTQYKTKIVNFDNTVMYVTRELESPGWLSRGARGAPAKTLLCGRPSNVRVISGREKELKAIIGRQEMMIRKLHNERKLASKIIECANLTKNNMNLEIFERGKDLSSPQYTPCADEGSSKRIYYCDSAKDSFDFTDINKIIKNMGDGETLQDSKVKSEEDGLACSKWGGTSPVDISGSPETSKDLSQGDAFVVQPDYYQVDPMHFWNQEVVADDDGSTDCTVNDADLTQHEANNNNYDTKNLNSDGKEKMSKCTVCEPTLGTTSDLAST